jgi:hypothetical protein
MGKNIAAGVAGVLIAGALVWLVEMMGHSVYPPNRCELISRRCQ